MKGAVHFNRNTSAINAGDFSLICSGLASLLQVDGEAAVANMKAEENAAVRKRVMKAMNEAAAKKAARFEV